MNADRLLRSEAVHIPMSRVRSRNRIDLRRIFFIIAGCLTVALLALASFSPRDGAATEPFATGRSVRAYQTATGMFPLPPAGQAQMEFAAAEAAAIAEGRPLAYTVWVEQDAFEQRAWRDLLQVGRIPIVRPPFVNFAREVAVLVWPAPGRAPAAVAGASGLLLSGVTLGQQGIEVRVSPSTSGPAPLPATVPPGTAVSPYVLITIPRTQWPRPVPPPVVPPVSVTLVS